MALLTIKQVILRIIIIISIAEFLIMLMIPFIITDEDPFIRAVLDTVILLILSTPPIYFLIIRPFVIARDQAIARIEQMALTDPLTKLANRRLLSQHLKKVIASNLRHKESGAVLLIDIDGFKPVNDTYGHDAGDALLVEIAARLQSIVRAEDIVSRLGGDEFVIVINRLDEEDHIARVKAAQMANKLISLIEKPHDYDGKKLHVSASIGIRILGPENLKTNNILNEADYAMYQAKQVGKGRAVFFDK